MEHTTEIDHAVKILKLLSDKTRLTMVKLLESNECCVCEFVAMFQLSQPAVSQHLRKLRDGEIVLESRRGQWVFYSLNKDTNNYTLIEEILKHLPDQGYRIKALEKQGLRMSCD